MPGKIKVKVLAGRNLPVMDRASDTTDAFVEIKFGGVTHKTDVCRKSLNPHWNSTEWYRFEVDESELQDEPLQLRLMDHDTYSANDAIGKVVISLAPLLAREANEPKSTTAPHGGAVMSGWIPVFDTMHGIRGELNVIVKVELFSDFNKYKTSSCGVQFFHCPLIPPGYRATAIHGFVEELVVNDDPEYQWIDKIRTPRASNEARQVAFIKLSNQVQRLVGLKAAELGANAVVGYQQDFDLEGEAGVVARAVGTAVSITPLPTHSQQTNIPPCTQQQLKKYLDILATDNDNVTDLNEYYQTHQEELQKLLNILNPNAPSLLDEPVDDEDDKSLDISRQSSTNTYAGNVSLYQDSYVSHKSLKHISEDQSELNRLLNRKDDYDSDTSSPLQKIKKLKTNFFTKKFSFRSRKSDRDVDLISLKSNGSENSKISISDIKCELKKLKKLKKPKFTKIAASKEDKGEGMASILARSVLHAHTSLACINESQDSEHSPGSTLRRTSESEPTISMADEDKAKNPNVEVSGDVITEDNVKRVPEIHFQSLTNISSEEMAPTRQRTISESCPTSPIVGRSDNLLKLPDEVGYYGSISSALSGESSEIYSSSEEDDESSDIKTDTDRSIETTSSVVRSVLNHEVDQAIVAQMNRKLSILERMTPEPHEIKYDDYIEKCKSADSLLHGMENNKNNENEVVKHEASTSTRDLSTRIKKAHSHYIKFHNPFANKKSSKSISAPSSPTEKTGFVYRSSKRIKNQLSKISNSSMIKSISHYSLLPKKKQPMKTLSRPSSSDVISKIPSETVLGSHFLSYSDLISLDKEGFGAHKKLHKSDELNRGKFSMYIGSEPASRASLSCRSSPPYKEEHEHHAYKKEKSALKPTGLVHTAMETILIDRVQSLLIPTSPDHISSETKQFFSDVSEKLEKVEESRNQQSPYEISHNPSRRKAQSLSPDTPQIVSVTLKPFTDDYRSNRYKGEKLRNNKPTGLVHTAMETILMEKVQNLMGPTTPDSTKSISYFQNTKISPDEHAKESPDVIDTAVNTVQTVPSEAPGPIIVKPGSQILTNKHSDKNTAKSNFTIKKPTGLVETAMKTILMDKVQNLCGSIIPESIVERKEKTSDTKDKNEWKESTGLVHTAMKTILADKVQYLICPQTSQSNQSKEINKSIQLEEVRNNEILKSPSLVNAAMESMSIEKNQASIGPSKHETDITIQKDHSKDNNELMKMKENTKNDKDSPLLSTGPESMFPCKVQDVLNTKITNNDFSKIQNKVSSGKNIEKTYNDPSLEEDDLVENTTEPSHLKVPNLNVIVKNTSVPTELENNLQEIKTSSANPLTEIMQLDKGDTPLANMKRDGKQPKLKEKKLVRQNSIHSVTESLKKSNDNIPNVSYKVTKPVLQHFHPVLSGAQLETIPSLPESSVDHTESLDVEDVETNNVGVSVCGNSHAVCGVDRNERDRDKCEKDKGSPRHARHESYGGREPAVQPAHAQNASLNASSTPMGIHRRSSDSDLSVTPKGSSLNMSAGNVGTGGGAILRPSMNSNNLDMLEYPFLTMTEFPPGFIVHIGGTVCARSVKLVDGGGESGARALWWAELRTELRAHARALRCNAVIAYVDTTAICEDVCVLSASGTAVVINLDCDFNADLDPSTGTSGSKNTIDEVDTESCSVAHVPYSPGSGPYRAELSTCGGCRRARVPAVLLATCAKPNRLTSYAKAVTLTAVAARVRRAPPTAEPGARDISDQLPFLEYELHKLLLAKLRMQGANALFSLQTQIAIGERCVMALASGTAFRLAALPPPTPPRIKASENDKEALELQKALRDSFTANKAANGYDIGVSDHITNGVLPEVEGDDPPALDLCADKDACVLELDEAEDVETARALAVRRVLPPVYSSNLKPLRGAPPHAFAQVWRGRIGGSVGAGSGGAGGAGERHVSRALHSVAYKLRRLSPCALAATRFQLELPEDEIQLVVSGTAIPLQDPSKPDQSLESGETALGGNHSNGCGDNDDDIFALDEEQLVRSNRENEAEEKPSVNGQSVSAVSLTTLSGVWGARGARRVCALRLLFVRETTTVRELGGLSGFLHTFTCEVLAIARAYTAALGGNALTSFYLTQLMLQDNAHKNQGQCLLSVGGDVVHMTY